MIVTISAEAFERLAGLSTSRPFYLNINIIPGCSVKLHLDKLSVEHTDSGKPVYKAIFRQVTE